MFQLASRSVLDSTHDCPSKLQFFIEIVNGGVENIMLLVTRGQHGKKNAKSVTGSGKKVKQRAVRL